MFLPYINMNLPQVHACSPYWTPFPIPSLWVISVHHTSSIMHRTWTGDSFHIWYYRSFNVILPKHPTLALSHRVQKTVLYICVSFAVSHTGLSFSSVHFSHSVVSSSLQPHELQHTRPPCPSPTAGVHSDSCPLSPWCHPAISSSLVPFSSCPQSLPASVFSNESTLRMWWPKYWSFSFSIIPSKEFPGLVGSPCSPRDSQESSPTPQFKSINSSAFSFP